MKITAENIEAYLLDYYTDQLNQSDRAAVENFLVEHPEWKIALEDLYFLPEDATQFPVKDRLLKSANEEYTATLTLDWYEKEQLLFLFSEGLLNDAQKLAFDHYRQADHIFNRNVELSKHVCLVPDYSTEFPSKAKLKRTETKKYGIVWLSTAAAAVLFIVAFLVNQSAMKQQKTKLAKESVVSYPSKIKRKINRERVEHKTSVSNLSIKDEDRGSLFFTNQKPGLKAPDRLKQPLDSVFYQLKQKDVSTQHLQVAVLDSADSIPSHGIEIAHINQSNADVNSAHSKNNESNEFMIGMRSVKATSNWQVASKKLANLSKNKVVFNGTSNRNFYLKIGKFSISRKKNIAKSNLSMR